MIESVSYKMLGGVLLLERRCPPKNARLNITVKDVQWRYQLSFAVQDHFNDSKCISVTLSFKLYYLNPKKKTSIAGIEVYNMFSVKGAESADAKLALLYKVLEITNWNLQGAMAALSEETPVATFIPPDIDFTFHQNAFKKTLADDWN
jgi:hypothetical protein